MYYTSYHIYILIIITIIIIDFEQANDLVNLHTVIKENKDQLNNISHVFDGFISELSDLIKDMPDNHVASLQISKSLEHRMISREQISQLVDKIVIPPDLIQNLVSEDVDEEYIKSINELTDRIKNLDSLMSTKAKFMEDIAYEIDLLKRKACRSVREFLLKLVISLRKPRTNIQILQHSKLLKYAPLNRFIYINSPSFATEIKNCYIETVSRTFTQYFRNYLTNLTKVFYQITYKTDLVGYVESVKGYFGTSFGKPVGEANKPSAFNLNVPNLPNDIWSSIRGEVVTQAQEKMAVKILYRSDIIRRCFDAPLIIPHTALKNNKKYPFEQIFRSINILLLDTVCSEYLFDRQWFAKPLVSNVEHNGLVQPIFDKVFQVYYENIGNFVSSTYDCLALLICIRINQLLVQQIRIRKLESITLLNTYFQRVDVILWDKFSDLFKRNIDSLKMAITKDPAPTDTRPHIYTRRFSEFYASILDIINCQSDDGIVLPESTLENQNSRVLAWVVALRSSYERLMIHFSNFFHDDKTKTIFLINNYDVVLTVLSENNITPQEETHSRFQTLIQEQTNIFVEQLLQHYYKLLISFIKDTEYNLSTKENYAINKDQLYTLVNEFSQRWRDVLHKIQNDIMTNFSNFNLGSSITKQIITQYLIYYKRFEEIYKKANKQPDLNVSIAKPTFTPISNITYEISKSYSSF